MIDGAIRVCIGAIRAIVATMKKADERIIEFEAHLIALLRAHGHEVGTYERGGIDTIDGLGISGWDFEVRETVEDRGFLYNRTGKLYARVRISQHNVKVYPQCKDGFPNVDKVLAAVEELVDSKKASKRWDAEKATARAYSEELEEALGGNRADIGMHVGFKPADGQSAEMVLSFGHVDKAQAQVILLAIRKGLGELG